MSNWGLNDISRNIINIMLPTRSCQKGGAMSISLFEHNQKAYEAASKEGETVNSDNAQSETASESKDDDVIDAEYTKEG